MNFPVVFSVLMGASFLVVCSVVEAEWFKEKQAIMGTEITVEIWHDKNIKAQQCVDDVFKEMWRIDALMSPFKENSELTKINNMAKDQPVVISIELFDLLKKSIKFSKISEGAFDITFSSIGYLYDYREGIQPTDAMINKNLAAINKQAY